MTLLSFSGSVAAAPPPWDHPWETTIRADHPLVGVVLDARTGARVDAQALTARLRDARFVLLGETHDNPDAHRAQAWLLGLMTGSDANRRPAVVMEMLDSDQADALADWRAGPDGADPATLGAAVGWADSGWPDWAMYQPIAAVALKAGLPILTGNLPSGVVRRVGTDGAAAVLGAEGLAPRALDAPLPDRLREALAEEIRVGHCNMLPEEALPSVIAAQRARDGEMARAMLAGAALPGTDGAVLIAGNGHVRQDRAVPWYLRRLAPDASVLSIAVMQVPPDMADAPGPADLRDTPEVAGDPPYDLILWVPTLEDVDPCEKFRAQLERMRERHGGAGGD